ncbi:uncharacterized protein EI97DRAFT_195391 [Westerdykella ornata]|uniref:Uncharacterized protein n=1 Tax=Westerdykella ornata TaxID=318751 RepID=A0A6A6J972_WESOR|nr:uncharacterized protein EI97DRAFT_195391 [Westerdykella ornata]KAF2272942.1 hypothetical protein EI97DRAFT_195391 [Westerdykella ornata]
MPCRDRCPPRRNGISKCPEDHPSRSLIRQIHHLGFHFTSCFAGVFVADGIVFFRVRVRWNSVTSYKREKRPLRPHCQPRLRTC